MVGVATKLAITEPDRIEASRGAELLGQTAAKDRAGLFLTKPNGDETIVELPSNVLEALRITLTRLVESNEVLLVDEEAELSPEEAAKILGVSRPLVYQRMDTGKLPFRQVGAHRRVFMRDVLALSPFEDGRRKAAKQLSDDTDDLEVTHAPSPRGAS